MSDSQSEPTLAERLDLLDDLFETVEYVGPVDDAWEEPEYDEDEEDEPLTKANPYHDEKGKFTSAGLAVKFSAKHPAPPGLNNVAFESALVPDTVAEWRDIPGQGNFQEPDLPVTEERIAAGVIIQEPDGRVWITEPKNHFGGYQHTFPKGSVDPGLTLRQTAIKEAYEETGLLVELTGHFGDFQRDTSIGRYYTARRVSGTPTEFGEETHQVKLVPPEQLGEFLNRTSDKEIAEYIGKHEELPPLEDLTVGNITGEQLSGAKGSNPGGFFKGADGKVRYVKFYADPVQPYGEHLANQLYRDLKLGAAKSVVLPDPDKSHALSTGKPVYASKALVAPSELADLGLTPERAHAILDGFAADVLMANWDAIGLSKDNILYDKFGGNVPIRIDNGGAFLTRAQGVRKPTEVLNEITEFDKYSSANKQYMQVFAAAGIKNGEMLGERLVKQVRDIVRLRNAYGGWKQYVEAKAPPGLQGADKDAIIAMLESRTEKLIERSKKAQVHKNLKNLTDKFLHENPSELESWWSKRHFYEYDPVSATHIVKANPNHYPAGSPKGGQFAPKGISGDVPVPPAGMGDVPWFSGESKTTEWLNKKLAKVVQAMSMPNPVKALAQIKPMGSINKPGQKAGPQYKTAAKFNQFLSEAKKFAYDMQGAKQAVKPVEPKPLVSTADGFALASPKDAKELGKTVTETKPEPLAKPTMDSIHGVKSPLENNLFTGGGAKKLALIQQAAKTEDLEKLKAVPVIPGSVLGEYKDSLLLAVHNKQMTTALVVNEEPGEVVGTALTSAGTGGNVTISMDTLTALPKPIDPNKAVPNHIPPSKHGTDKYGNQQLLDYANAKLAMGTAFQNPYLEGTGFTKESLANALTNNPKLVEDWPIKFIEQVNYAAGSINPTVETAAYLKQFADVPAPKTTTVLPSFISILDADDYTYKQIAEYAESWASAYGEEFSGLDPVLMEQAENGWWKPDEESTWKKQLVMAINRATSTQTQSEHTVAEAKEMLAQFKSTEPKDVVSPYGFEPGKAAADINSLTQDEVLDYLKVNGYNLIPEVFEGASSKWVALQMQTLLTHSPISYAAEDAKQNLDDLLQEYGSHSPAASSPYGHVPGKPLPDGTFFDGLGKERVLDYLKVNGYHFLPEVFDTASVGYLAVQMQNILTYGPFSYAAEDAKEVLDELMSGYGSQNADVLAPEPYTLPQPVQPDLVPGHHGVAHWNNKTIKDLTAAVNSDDPVTSVANVAISPKHHNTVKEYKKQLLAYLGATGVPEPEYKAKGWKEPKGKAETKFAEAAKAAQPKIPPKPPLPPAPPASTDLTKYPLEAQELFKQKIQALQQAYLSDDPETALYAVTGSSTAISGYKSLLVQTIDDWKNTLPQHMIVHAPGAVVSTWKLIAEHKLGGVNPDYKPYPQKKHADLTYHGKLRDTLPQLERQGLTDFQNNLTYRKELVKAQNEKTTFSNSTVKGLDAALQRIPSKWDIQIIRQIDSTMLAAKAVGMVGHVVEDPGFLNGSIDGKTYESRNVALKLNVPKGVPFFYVATHGYAHEKEAILPRRTRFRIDKVTKEGGWKTVIWATVLPPDEQTGWIKPNG